LTISIIGLELRRRHYCLLEGKRRRTRLLHRGLPFMGRIWLRCSPVDTTGGHRICWTSGVRTIPSAKKASQDLQVHSRGPSYPSLQYSATLAGKKVA